MQHSAKLIVIFIVLLVKNSLALYAQNKEIPTHKGFIGSGIFIRNVKGGGQEMVLTPEIEYSLGENVDVGLTGRIGFNNGENNTSTLLGLMPFCRFHYYILGNHLDPFVDFGIGAERVHFDITGHTQYSVDVGLRPGLRIPFIGSSLLIIQVGFFGYEYRNIPGGTATSKFHFLRANATDIRVGLLIYL